MNSLNIISARVIGPAPKAAQTNNRPRSHSEGQAKKANTDDKPRRSASQHVRSGAADQFNAKEKASDINSIAKTSSEAAPEISDEKTPLLSKSAGSSDSPRSDPRYKRLRIITRQLLDAITKSVAWVLSTLVSPGVHVVTGLYDEKGHFAPLLPFRRLGRVVQRKQGGRSTAQAVGLSGSSGSPESPLNLDKKAKNSRRKPPSGDSRRKTKIYDTHAATSESEPEVGDRVVVLDAPPEARPKPQSSSSSEEIPQTRRSVRIRLYSEDTTRRRKPRKEKTGSGSGGAQSSDKEAHISVSNIKSPTSPASSLKITKYPRTLAPPRPLLPRRQPSYSTSTSSRPGGLTQKTLVIDLDETLIHSLAKGGRMSSGHMVEVKLNSAVGFGGATPQHPILYYVHKRPHCDDFLRKVCKWYNLVVFTASVQEYADPVIDWLEQERKYFSSRYYRQHCTLRNGAYIKDLSSVEPDLSRVMILDNSPLSYIFHEGAFPGRYSHFERLTGHR